MLCVARGKDWILFLVGDVYWYARYTGKKMEYGCLNAHVQETSQTATNYMIENYGPVIEV